MRPSVKKPGKRKRSITNQKYNFNLVVCMLLLEVSQSFSVSVFRSRHLHAPSTVCPLHILSCRSIILLSCYHLFISIVNFLGFGFGSPYSHHFLKSKIFTWFLFIFVFVFVFFNAGESSPGPCPY